MNKQKQVVVNATEESKKRIADYKKEYNLSDKEFVAVVIAILDKTDPEAIKTAVELVAIENQKAKIRAKIARNEAKLKEAEASE